MTPTRRLNGTSSGWASNGKPVAPTSATGALAPGQLSQKKSSANTRWWLLAVCAIIVAVYALLVALPTRVANQEVKTRMFSTPAGWFHIIGGLIALGTGPFQFHKEFRTKSPKSHRILGRIYAFSNISSAIGGFWVTFNSYAYPIGQVGFATLAALWLFSCCIALQAIWNGDIKGHRVWMARNYSLTYAAVMLRWQLPLLVVCGFSMEGALSAEGFLCWMPNLVFTEWWLQRPQKTA